MIKMAIKIRDNGAAERGSRGPDPGHDVTEKVPDKRE
jgi:hypothetical protein